MNNFFFQNLRKMPNKKQINKPQKRNFSKVYDWTHLKAMNQLKYNDKNLLALNKKCELYINI